MFYYLHYLKGEWIIFNLFRYITFRAFMASLTSFFIVWVGIPYFIRFAKALGLKERISEDVPESHRDKEGTPTSGGILMVMGVVISSILWAKLQNGFIWIAILATLMMSIMGFIDDRLKLVGVKKKGLSKKSKLIVQFIASLIVFFYVVKAFGELATRTQILFFKNIFLAMGVFYPIFMIFVFIGATNAINLTDGLDGLAAGSALAPMGVFMLVAYIEGNTKFSHYLKVLYIPGVGELTIFSAAWLGALLAFLWYNAPPAELFMGDSGSQGLGSAFAVIAILTKQELLLAIAGLIFVSEALSVILQVAYFKLTSGKRIFRKAPLHHHFEMAYASKERKKMEAKIVIRFWIASMIASLIALATLKIR